MLSTVRRSVWVAVTAVVFGGVLGSPAVDAPQNPQNRPVIMLGDLNPPPSAASQGAPFDPCDPAMWDGVPAQVRPAKPNTPRNVPPKDPSPTPYMMCVLEHSDPVSVSVKPDGSASHSTGAILSIYIGWGEPLADVPGAAAAQFAGRAGVQKSSVDDKGRARCDTRVQLQRGSAGVIVLNQKFPMVDACAIGASVTTHIATVAR